MRKFMMVDIDRNENKWILFFIALLPFLSFISKGSVDVTFSLMALFLLWNTIKNKDNVWLLWPWMQVILAFVSVAMLSAIFSPLPQQAFVQSFIYLRWPLAAVALITLVFTTEYRIRLFEKSALFFLLLMIADGLLQMSTGFDILGHQAVDGVRMTAFFKKRVLGVYSLKVFFFAFAFIYIVMKKNNKNYVLMTFIIVVFDIFLLLTGERIVFLLGILFLVVWVFVLGCLVREIRVKLSVLVLSAIALSFTFIISNHQLLIKRVLPFWESIKNFSATTYSDIFNAAYQLWLLSPLFGIGTRMYHEVCVAKLGYPQDEALFEQVEGLCVRHPHNIYLEILAQNGMVGLVIFVVFLYLIFRIIAKLDNWKKDPLLTTIIVMSIVVIFWPLTSSMSIFANNYAGAVWLTIAWAITRTRYISINQDLEETGRRL